MEISEGTNRLAELLSEILGGAGEVSMLPLAEEVDDELGEPSEEDALVQKILSNVASEDGEDYDEYGESLGECGPGSSIYVVREGEPSDIPSDGFDSSDMGSLGEGFDFSDLDPEEQDALIELGQALESGDITEEDLYDLLD